LSKLIDSYHKRIKPAWATFLLWLAKRSPPQLIALSFATAILIGTVLLALPISHTAGSLGLLNALFTATSAICVTGLAVANTSTDLTLFGKVILLLLIQAGGFGFITAGTLAVMASGRRISFRERMNLQAQMNVQSVGGVVDLVRKIALLVASVELIGALLLFVRFRELHGNAMGAFYALFHSISAFNNAGFAFYSDSLMGFVGDPLVNVTILLLVLLGGLGFIVIIDILSRTRSRSRHPLSLHSKMVLSSSAFLIVFGVLVVLLFEWTNPATMGSLSLSEKLWAGLFQGITPRTAGFNTLDYGNMRGGTLMVTFLLMFIGGNPGSTAGGIKTVTFFVLIASALSTSRGQSELYLFKRMVNKDVIMKAGVIALFATMVIGAAMTLLLLSEPHIDRFALLFETISAIGTVGLSMGVTSQLSAMGKIIIILLMYLGRLGALTFALALMQRPVETHIKFPAEDILIG